jgi:hypothetical protein
LTVEIDWPSGEIFIPQSELTHVSGLTYQLDVNEFRLALKDLEDNSEGIVWSKTHNHNTSTLLSGVIYARQVEILDPYNITFEDVGSPYTVVCINANHNIADKKNVNNVSLIIGNSAGLIVVYGAGATPAEIANEVWNEPRGTNVKNNTNLIPALL